MTPGFFNIYKPRKYGYRYIYYDPKKEAQKEREKRLAEMETNPDEEFKSTIHRGSFREEYERNKTSRSSQNTSSNLRTILILAILIAIAYFLVK